MPYTYNPISQNLDYYTVSTVLSGTISDHGDLTGLSDDDHTQYHTNTRGDARYYTKTDLNTGQLDTRYYTGAEVNVISGSLKTDIDGKDNYSNWNFAVDGVTKDSIASGDELNFVSGNNITITRSADDEITISGSTGVEGTTDHSALNNLDYASAGHTGFASSASQTTLSGNLQTDIDGKSDIGHAHDNRYYTESEVDTISGSINSTITTNKNNYIDGPLSPQRLTGFTLSSGTNSGTVKVGAGTALLRTTDSESGELKYFNVDEQDNITITASGTIYRVVLQYNSNNPQIVLQESKPNRTTDIPLGKFIKSSYNNLIHWTSGGYRLNNGIAKLHRRIEHIRLWEMCSEIQITDEGSKHFSIAAGHFYKGINEIDFSKFDTSDSGRFTYVYYDGSNWIYNDDQTEIDVNNYNNITSGLSTCNKYKCDWVFVHPDDGHVYVVYGQDNGTLTAIENSTVPNVEDFIDVFGALIGRIIIDCGVEAFNEIQMIQTTTFNITTAVIHNDLSGLQGGIEEQYYHLTSAQRTDLTDSNDCSIHTHDNRYYTESEVDTISGSLQTNIDSKDNYSSWSFAVGGVTKDAITSNDILNFVGGDNIDITRSAEDEITISGSDTYETTYIDAAAMVPCTTSSPLQGTKEYSTNDIDMDHFAFDAGATKERVQFKLKMPENWDLGTLKVKFDWSSATGSTAGDTVEFGIKARALSDSDVIDIALGTAQIISDTLLADDGADLQTTAATPALTVGGTPSLGDLILFEVYRNTDGVDSCAEDGFLFGCTIQYKLSGAVAAW